MSTVQGSENASLEFARVGSHADIVQYSILIENTKGRFKHTLAGMSYLCNDYLQMVWFH